MSVVDRLMASGLAALTATTISESISTNVQGSDSGSIQAAHDALPSTGGMIILAPNTTYTLKSQLLITKPNVHLWAPSWGTVIKRASTFTSGDMIKTTGINTICEGFAVDGNSVAHSSSEMNIQGADGLSYRCQFVNCYGSINLALAAAGAMARLNTLTGPGINGVGGYGIWAITNNIVFIQSNKVRGMNIDGIGFDGPGSQCVNNDVALCHWQTSPGGGQIVCYPNSRGVLIGANSVDAGGAAASQGLELNGNNITIASNTLRDQKHNGMIINPGSYSGYLFSANTVINSGKSITHPALSIESGVSNVNVTSNNFIDTQGTAATQNYAVLIQVGAGDNINMSANTFLGNSVAPIGDLTTNKSRTIGANVGIDNVMGTIASGATLTLPYNPVISLTGSATATSIAGALWTGRQGKFIPTGAAVFTAGATIGNTVTAAANVPLAFTFDGTKLYLG